MIREHKFPDWSYCYVVRGAVQRGNNWCYKIGHTKSIKSRLLGLRSTFSSVVDPILVIEHKDANKIEKGLHKKFSAQRDRSYGASYPEEVFYLSIQDIEWIKETYKEFILDPEWYKTP